MDCISPLHLSPPRGTVPCGKCIACLKRRQDDWSIRLTKEYENSFNCYFLTLTYSDDCVPVRPLGGEPTKVLLKRDIQLWLKRLRKSLEPHKIRFFACGEYGPTTLRPHYHVIIFNFPQGFQIQERVNKTWRKGYITYSLVTPARVRYVAKYCACYTFLPPKYRHKMYRPFVLCSRRPAIGGQYLTPSIVSYHRDTLSTVLQGRDGVKFALPKYYRDRIFDDQMKFDIRQRTDVYREQQIADYKRKYFRPEYRHLDPLKDKRDDFIRIQSKLIKSRKL